MTQTDKAPMFTERNLKETFNVELTPPYNNEFFNLFFPLCLIKMLEYPHFS